MLQKDLIDMGIKKNARCILTSLFLLLSLTGCSHSISSKANRQDYTLSHDYSSLAQNERIRFLVFHYTAADNATSLKLLTGNNVSAHYIIPESPDNTADKPLIYQLVHEDKRAWHAGVSNWNGRDNLNDSSVGIEIVNRGFSENMLGHKTWYPYDEKQIKALVALSRRIIQRYNITPDNVVGHSDIAPLRKQDPGKLFPWKQLAAQGIGAWPEAEKIKKYLNGRLPTAPVNVHKMQVLLKTYGYDAIPQTGVLDEETIKTIQAFQMHFRPALDNGIPDAETEAIAQALNEQYRPKAID
ncbi:N-acetylmuramoyl-L-alanine amidase [Pantoea ananatis]|uniref:N-acetylmuramoyl-L-alanine amidase n=1 Tax=Pantoea ananas TaxID=553 RepID=UPI000F867B76|nr:N-acetylmuramoyl-L-alanine amidase [Pantoea ananatis]RQN03846.1 N-acetylmuramoyl-L-alanine amidase [Pantoea ananatis]